MAGKCQQESPVGGEERPRDGCFSRAHAFDAIFVFRACVFCHYSTRHMNTLSDLSVFESLFQSALKEYENQTGVDIAKHPFAAQLECCDSVESITQALQDQAEAFVKFRGNDKVTTLIKNSVQILHRLSATVAHGETIGLVTLVRAKMADRFRISLYLTLRLQAHYYPTRKNDTYRHWSPSFRMYLRSSFMVESS